MSDFELSWYLKINNQRNCGVKPKATLADSYQPIKTALNHSGVVSITLQDCPKLGSPRLQLLRENGQCTITLGEGNAKTHPLRGDSWNDLNVAVDSSMTSSSTRTKQLICDENTKVYEIVENFFATGTVSLPSLSSAPA